LTRWNGAKFWKRRKPCRAKLAKSAKKTNLKFFLAFLRELSFSWMQRRPLILDDLYPLGGSVTTFIAWSSQ